MRPGRAVLGRVLMAVGVLGVVLSLLGIVIGLRLSTSFDATLRDSIGLTADALDVVDDSVAVTAGAVASLTEGLGQAGDTTRTLGDGIGDAVVVLDATADLTEDEVAASLQEVDDALPALIDVAAVIDRTLSALSDVPFGPDYDPAEPFDESLRSIQRELDGLPEALRAQADLVRQASGSLAEVRTGTTSIADQLDELERSLQDADRLMDGYADTTARARTVVERRQRELDGDLRSARLLVVALGLTVAAANVAPIGLGWVLDHPSSGAV